MEYRQRYSHTGSAFVRSRSRQGVKQFSVSITCADLTQKLYQPSVAGRCSIRQPAIDQQSKRDYKPMDTF
ncbi:hypothetical protein K4039_08815 [Lyngbya sp. CCAP 1446/10]|uniref:hypothetical protein n=1 Tax=Lyngbya sp. CCAP 1446/10 TaxID=439293 RepID=UPI0022374D22|nr:hypothetical protein [Lyngbya sp. CCAP 1446/10]MCW6050182.1 hypothetical protein [Lyngbya sp. CCAP 1446/10]